MANPESLQIATSLKIIVRSSLFVFLGLIFSKVISYLYRIVIARYFGAEAYGLFSLAVIIAGWFTTLAGLGLSDGILRYLVIYEGKKQKSNYLLKWILGITLASSIFAGLLLFFLAKPLAVDFFNNARLTIFLQFFSLTVPLLALTHVYLSVLRSYQHIAWYSFIINVFQNVVKIALIGILIFLGFGLSSVTLSYVLGIAAMLVLVYVVVKRKVPDVVKRDVSQNETKGSQLKREILRYSFPLLFYNLLWVIFYWVHSVSLGYYKTATVVGVYNAAVPIALLLSIAPELFTQIFLPLITRAFISKKKNLVEQLSKQVSKWIFLINLPALLLVFLFPETILNLLFGDSFIAGADALRVLALSTFITSCFAVWPQLIYAQGKSSDFLRNMVIAALANVILNFILIPLPSIGPLNNESGMVGAALATLFSMTLFNLLFLSRIRAYLGTIPLRRKMLNILCAAIIPSLIAYIFFQDRLMWVPFIGMALLFGLMYLACLWIFRAFDRHDADILLALKKKLLATKS